MPNVQEALRDARQPDRPAVEGVAGGAAVARRPDAGDRRDREAPGGCRRMSALPSRQAYPLRPGAARRPAVAVPVLQAALFFIDRRGPCPRPFAGPLSSGGLRHVQRSSLFVSPTGQARALDKMTIRRWRRKIIRALGGSGASSLGGWSTWTRSSSAKAARARASGSGMSAIRSVIRKPDRMRWFDCKRTGTKLPAGISQSRIPVLTMADRAGARRADAVPEPQRAAADGGARTMPSRRRGPVQRP